MDISLAEAEAGNNNRVWFRLQLKKYTQKLLYKFLNNLIILESKKSTNMYSILTF